MTSLTDMIAAESEWLSVQPEFGGGWEVGVQRVTGSLEEWLQGYATDLLTLPLSAKTRQRMLPCLWRVWAQHWRQAIMAESTARRISGIEVADTLRRGVRPSTGRSMGGDPLRDMTLARACMDRDARALEQLFLEYRGVFELEASRCAASDDADPWQELFVVLVGHDTESNPRLGSYAGVSSLRIWLRQVARNFLIDSRRRRRCRYLAERAKASGNAGPGRVSWVAVRDVVMDCRHLMADCLPRLDERERDVLVFSYHLGLHNQAIAQRLGRSASQATRIRQRALSKLMEYVGPYLATSELGGAPSTWAKDPDEVARFFFFCYLHDLQETFSENPLVTMITDETTIVESPIAAAARRVKRSPSNRAATSSSEAAGSAPRLRAVTITPDDSPDQIVHDQESLAVVDRSELIYLDGRNHDVDQVAQWLGRLDALVFESIDSSPEPYSPHCVVLARSVPEGSWSAELRNRPDVHWIATADRDGEAAATYQATVERAFAEILDPPDDQFEEVGEGDLADDDEDLPPAQREAWQAFRRGVKDSGQQPPPSA